MHIILHMILHGSHVTGTSVEVGKIKERERYSQTTCYILLLFCNIEKVFRTFKRQYLLYSIHQLFYHPFCNTVKILGTYSIHTTIYQYHANIYAPHDSYDAKCDREKLNATQLTPNMRIKCRLLLFSLMFCV